MKEQQIKRKKVIIDTDMGWDDVLSILYLMKLDDIEIIGVAVTGCGETNLRWGQLVATTLMALGKQLCVPVAAGTETPTALDHRFPQSFRNEGNTIMGLLGTLNPPDTVSLDDRTAWQMMSDLLEAHDNVTILCIGGFTNISKMLELHPNTKLDHIKRIYAMGGAVYVDGNVARLNNAKPEWDQGSLYANNYVAEWNIFVDPYATKKVFDSSIPLTLVPLDACNSVLLSPDYATRVHSDEPMAMLARGVLDLRVNSNNENTWVPIFDPLTTMIMAGDLPGYESTELYLDVTLEDCMTNNRSGNVHPVASGSRKIEVVQAVSEKAFSDRFLSVINSQTS